MKYLISIFLVFNFIKADLTIAYDTKSIGDSKEISEVQKVEVDKILQIAKENNIKITFKAVPWKRALLMIEKGLIDGVIQASYKTSRAQFAVYPTKNGSVDDNKRLNDGNSYYIYRYKDSKLTWDGTKFINTGVVAAMDKYAVIEDLEKHSNIKTITFTKNAEIVRELAKGKFDAYAGSARITDNLLKKFPVLATNIIRDSLPIRKKPYFLIFSKVTYKEKAKEMEQIWDGLEKLNNEKQMDK